MHPELLYDGLHIADKNDSDIVYFKQASSTRNVPVHAFKKSDEKADIVNNHLFRSAAVFKLFKRKMLVDNNILFDPSLTVYEDTLFSYHALIVAETVSILADKDYFIKKLHGQDHLIKRKRGHEGESSVLLRLLVYVLLSKKVLDEKIKMFSVLSYKYAEFLIKVLKKPKVTDDRKRVFFKIMHSSLAAHSDFYNAKFIRKKFESSVQFLLDGEYEKFQQNALMFDQTQPVPATQQVSALPEDGREASKTD